eukprot:6016730-Pyramimonas_sp.AAC.1
MKGPQRRHHRNMVACVAGAARALTEQDLGAAHRPRAWRRGVQITAARSGIYWGVDLGGGRAHARARRLKRAMKHTARRGKVRRFGRALREAKLTARLET